MNDIERMRAKLAEAAASSAVKRSNTCAIAAINAAAAEADAAGGEHHELIVGLMLAVLAYGDQLGLDRAMLADVFSKLAREAEIYVRAEGL